MKKPNRRERRAVLNVAGGERARIALALDVGTSLPTEFRLFVRGENTTEKGKFVFDDAAARSVMASYRKWGIDVPIDLEHQMLDLDGGEADPTARDARGWCKLELRSDGSLWATDVRWTPDGAARLTEKRQRYVSPAFDYDPKTRRVLKLMNVAITALPATHNTPALVAAAARGKKMTTLRTLVTLAASSGLDPELVKQALDAIEAGDDEAARTILKNMIAAAAGAPAEPDADDAGSEGDGAEGVAPADENMEKPPEVAASAEPDDSDDEKDEDAPAKKAMHRALRASLRRMTGKRTVAEAVVEVEAWRASHLSLESQRTQLAAERAVLESAERRTLVTKLVTLGAEFPATVWADDKATVIKSRWLKMPLAELRTHVAEQAKARAPKAKTPGSGPAPVVVEPTESVELSAAELAHCKATGCDPKVFASLRARRDGKATV